jgi:hypothetical protein
VLRYRLTVVLAALLGLALVAAGCGSDEKTISKAEFLRKGNAICASGNKEIDAGANKIFRNRKSRPSQADIKRFANEVLLPSVERQVKGIKDLGAPKGDEDKVKAILDAADEGIAAGKRDPASLASDNADPFAKANRLARAYGLTVCGS